MVGAAPVGDTPGKADDDRPAGDGPGVAGPDEQSPGVERAIGSSAPPEGVDRVLVRFARTVDRATAAIGSLSKWFVFAAVVVGFVNVILRYVGRTTGRSLASNTYLELQTYFYGFLFLLAFAVVLQRGINVRVDFWYDDRPRRTQLRIDLVGHLIALLPFTLLGIWVSWSRVLTSWGRRPDGSWPSGWQVWETWEVSGNAGGLPQAPLKTMLLLGFVLLAIQALSEIAKVVVALRGHEDEVDLASGMVGAVKIE